MTEHQDKAESGERPPSPDVLASWCELTGMTGPDMHADLFGLARVLRPENVLGQGVELTGVFVI